MTGTYRMNELAVQTVVRLKDGLSKTPRLKFAWGAPVDPITVGMRGQWAIMSDSMLDVHLHLGFDGKQLLVALAAPNAAAVLNGRPLQGQQWWPVSIPGTLQFGGAELKVENEGPALDLSASPNSSFDTLFDGGVLRERARALSEPPLPPAGAAQPSPMGFHTPAPQRDVMWPGVTATPAPLDGTLQSKADAKQQLRGVGEDLRKRSSGTAPPTVLPSTPAAKKGFWAEASVPKKVSIGLLPVALAAVLYSLDNVDAEPEQAAPVAAASAKGTPASTAPATVAVAAGASTVAIPRLAKTPAGPADAGGSLSASATSTKSATSVVSTSPAPTAVVSPTPVAEASAAPKEVPVGAPGNAPSTASPRAALDAAFLGNLKDASRLYAKLADANPNNQAYRLAARLAAEDAVRRP